MAQFGSALDWGSRGRGFKSRQPDQKEIKADIMGLRHDIFLESGTREHADGAVFNRQSDNYKDLDRRLRLVEVKFPDLAQSAALPCSATSPKYHYVSSLAVDAPPLRQRPFASEAQ